MIRVLSPSPRRRRRLLFVLLVDGAPEDDIQESIRRQAFDVERVRSYEALEERSPTPRPDLVVVADPLDAWPMRAALGAYDRWGVAVVLLGHTPRRPMGLNETRSAADSDARSVGPSLSPPFSARSSRVRAECPRVANP